MKTIHLSVLVCFTLAANTSFALRYIGASTTDSTGLPGDHFSLQGALDVFKSSASLEEFEKKLNTEDNAVNNLDLNGDGDIDYVRVVDNKKDHAHAIVLQVPVSETESQDVAVIELEKNGNESAIVQITGDEELYGDSIYVEPFDEKEDVEDTKNKKGPSVSSVTPVRIIVNVWFWPCVKFVYAPAYIVWVSPWKWHHYPLWWKPWRPHPWRWHHQHCIRYHAYYHPVHIHRVMAAHTAYTPHRRTSAVVKTRYKGAHTAYKANRGMTGKPYAVKRTRPAGKAVAKPGVTKNPKSLQKPAQGGMNKGGKAPGGGIKRGRGGRK